jgi:hypothetical protein
MGRGSAASPPQHTHRLHGGPAVIRSRPRLLRVHAELLVPAAPWFEASLFIAKNPSSTRFIPDHIRPQGSPGIDPRVPMAGHHILRTGTPLSGPHNVVALTAKTLNIVVPADNSLY